MIQTGSKLPEGAMPQYEVFDLKLSGKPIRIRFNFYEQETEDGCVWSYNYVTVTDLKYATLKAAKVPAAIIKLVKQ